MYKEDFETEREDRGRAHATIDGLKRRLALETEGRNRDTALAVVATGAECDSCRHKENVERLVEKVNYYSQYGTWCSK